MGLLEDLALGRRAVDTGYLRQEQVDRCLAETGEGESRKALGEVLIARGLLTAEQVARLRDPNWTGGTGPATQEFQVAGTLMMDPAPPPVAAPPPAAAPPPVAAPAQTSDPGFQSMATLADVIVPTTKQPTPGGGVAVPPGTKHPTPVRVTASVVPPVSRHPTPTRVPPVGKQPTPGKGVPSIVPPTTKHPTPAGGIAGVTPGRGTATGGSGPVPSQPDAATILHMGPLPTDVGPEAPRAPVPVTMPPGPTRPGSPLDAPATSPATSPSAASPAADPAAPGAVGDAGVERSAVDLTLHGGLSGDATAATAAPGASAIERSAIAGAVADLGDPDATCAGVTGSGPRSALAGLASSVMAQSGADAVARSSAGSGGTAIHATAVSRAAALPPVAGATFARYQIVNEIARGAMGIVYRVYDPVLKRRVALKVMISGDTPTGDLAQRFKREAMMAAKVRHPNIVQVYDVGDFENKLYYTMELIEGDSLQGVLKKMGRIPPRTALRICRDAARALHTAHEAGLIHRDIKPANIMITARERHRDEAAPSEDALIPIGEVKTSSFRVLVADFGIAKDVTSQTLMTRAGAVVGTPAYMSPEQAGEPDKIGAHSDVYSLGVVLYHVLCGSTPFTDADPIRLLAQVITNDPPPLRSKNRDLHPDLETIVMKALERDPERRYESAAAFADDMDRYLSGEMIRAKPSSAAYRFMRRMRRWRAALVPAAAAVVLSFGLAGWFVVRPMLAAQAARAQAEEHFRQATASAAIAEKCLMTGRTAELGAHWQDAVAELDRALAQDPEYTEAWSLRGRVRTQAGQREAALGDLDEAIRRDPQNVAARYERAKVLVAAAIDMTAALLARGQPPRGAAVLKPFQETAGRALADLAVVVDAKSGTSLWMVLHARGAQAFLNGDAEAAGKALDEAVAKNPFLDDALDLRGYCRLVQRRAPEALADFEAAVKVNPLNVTALNHRGLALAAAGKPDAAVASYEEALRVHPGFVRARVNLAVARLDLGQAEPALAELNRALTDDPRNLHGLETRGRARLGLGRSAEAEQDFAEVVDRNPENLAAWIGRAVARRLQGNAAGALADAEAGTALDPRSVPALLEHALAAEALGKTDVALADYGRALAVDPGCLDALVNRAGLHSTGGRKAEARADLEEFLRSAGAEHARRKEVEEALEKLNQ